MHPRSGPPTRDVVRAALIKTRMADVDLQSLDPKLREIVQEAQAVLDAKPKILTTTQKRHFRTAAFAAIAQLQLPRCVEELGAALRDEAENVTEEQVEFDREEWRKEMLKHPPWRKGEQWNHTISGSPTGAANEKRIAPDGEAYSKQEFQEFYGGFSEWAAALPVAPAVPVESLDKLSLESRVEAPPVVVQPPIFERSTSSLERRAAPDGEMYTKAEFVQFFGGLTEWDAGAPEEPEEPKAELLGFETGGAVAWGTKDGPICGVAAATQGGIKALLENLKAKQEAIRGACAGWQRGTWMVVHGTNQISYQLPGDPVSNEIKAFIEGSINGKVESVAVAALTHTGPGGVIVYKQDGKYKYFTAGCVPTSLFEQLDQFVATPRAAPIKCIAFGDSEHWILLQGKSGFSCWGSVKNLHEELNKIREAGRENTLVTFTPEGGWILITNGCGFGYKGSDVPQIVKDGLKQAYEEKRQVRVCICT